MSARPIDAVLSRLERVKRVGDGRWMACSPTRNERTPSLSIRELDDGRVLVHDFGGSSVDDVLCSIGMRVDDLFPDTGTRHQSAPQRIAPAGDLLQLAAFESSVIAVIAADMLKGAAPDMDRLMVAASRLGDMAEACRRG